VNYIPTNIDAGTLFIETWGGTREQEPGGISREGTRD
jgi:hypothetical protein